MCTPWRFKNALWRAPFLMHSVRQIGVLQRRQHVSEVLSILRRSAHGILRTCVAEHARLHFQPVAKGTSRLACLGVLRPLPGCRAVPAALPAACDQVAQAIIALRPTLPAAWREAWGSCALSLTPAPLSLLAAPSWRTVKRKAAAIQDPPMDRPGPSPPDLAFCPAECGNTLVSAAKPALLGRGWPKAFCTQAGASDALAGPSVSGACCMS